MPHENNHQQTPYEVATTGTVDPRSETDLAVDWIDPRLTDLLHAVGALEAGDEGQYNREMVLNIARAAYGRGAKDGSDNPEAMKKFMGEDFVAAKKELLASQTRATHADISSLPETPPETPNN